MLCRLHTVYKIIHCAALHTLCDITQRFSNYYTLYSKRPFFAFNLEKNYTRQKKFTQAPLVVLVTIMRYGCLDTQPHPMPWYTSTNSQFPYHLGKIFTLLLKRRILTLFSDNLGLCWQTPHKIDSWCHVMSVVNIRIQPHCMSLKLVIF